MTPERFHQESILSREMEPGVERLWLRFSEIATIPRPSTGEGLMIDYLRKYASERSWFIEQDETGNLLVTVPATQGYEDKPGIIIQAHMDMVCVPPGIGGPATEGVTLSLDDSGEWVQAEGTTLGADNGIGFAAGLALLDEDIPHGPLKFLATVDEEQGLTGAMKLGFSESDTTGDRFLINLDTEDDDELTIGCAGGGDTDIRLPINEEDLGDRILLQISVDNLLGGHSGVVIHENRTNAIKLLQEIISEGIQTIPDLDARLVSVSGGHARNAIAPSAEAILAVDSQAVESFLSFITEAQQNVKANVALEGEKNVSLKGTKEIHGAVPDSVLSESSTHAVLQLLRQLPHGVKQMSMDVEGLAETSTNLALIKRVDGEIQITMLTRSLINEKLEEFRKEISDIAYESGAEALHSPAYPGWKPEPKSDLVELITAEYTALTQKKMKVKAIHAGLECGVILANKKFSHLQAVSFGPTITGAHTIEERVHVASVDQTYNLLKNFVSRVAQS